MACVTNYSKMASVVIKCEDVPTGGLQALKLGILGDHPIVTEDDGATYTTDLSKKLIELTFNKKDEATKFNEVTNTVAGGSKVTVPTVTVQFAGINKATRDAIMKLANPMVKVCIFATTADGKIWALGREFGMMLTSVTMNTGTSASDFNGYRLTFTGEEKEKALEIQHKGVGG